MKFYKSKKAEGVFIARNEKGEVVYLYGTIADLMKAGLLIPGFCDDQNGNVMEAYAASTWVSIDRNRNSVEYDSKEELKEAIRGIENEQMGKRYYFSL